MSYPPFHSAGPISVNYPGSFYQLHGPVIIKTRQFKYMKTKLFSIEKPSLFTRLETTIVQNFKQFQ